MNAEADAAVETETGEVQILRTQTELETEVDVDTGTDVEEDTVEGGDATTEADGADITADSEVEVGVLDGTFLFVRSDLLAELEGSGEEAGDVDPTTVADDATLAAYAQSLLVSDEHAEEVEVTADEVILTYKQRAEFLGFIPVLVNTTATVDATGEVNISYPWYNFMATEDEDGLRAAIEANIQAVDESEVTTDEEVTEDDATSEETTGEDTTEGEAVDDETISVTFTAQEKAQVLAGLYSAMQSELEASAEVEAEAQVEAE